jgi:hypothetical protein
VKFPGRRRFDGVSRCACFSPAAAIFAENPFRTTHLRAPAREYADAREIASPVNFSHFQASAGARRLKSPRTQA